MNEEFFEWLDNCPTQWFFQEYAKDGEENGRTYYFIDNDEEEENE